MVKTTKIGNIAVKSPSWEYQVIAAFSYAIISLFGGFPNYNNSQTKIPFTITDESIKEYENKQFNGRADYRIEDYRIDDRTGRSKGLSQKVLDNPDEDNKEIENLEAK